jgi:acetyl esterase
MAAFDLPGDDIADPGMLKIVLATRAALATRRPFYELTPLEFRAQLAADRARAAVTLADLPRVEDLQIPCGPGLSMPARLYSATPRAEGQPLFLYLHGGGWSAGSIETHDHVARQLALVTAAAVVSLDYPLLPEQPFPAAPTQCAALVQWLAANGGSLGLDGSRIAMGGDSAGANISAATAVALRDAGVNALSLVIPVYGAFAPDLDEESHRTNGDGRWGLQTASVYFYWQHYVGSDPATRRHPLAAPLHADLRGLPPMLVIAGGLDAIRDESRLFAAALARAGQEVHYKEYPGLTHSFLHYYATVKPAAECIRLIGRAVDARLRGGP